MPNSAISAKIKTFKHNARIADVVETESKALGLKMFDVIVYDDGINEIDNCKCFDTRAEAEQYACDWIAN